MIKTLLALGLSVLTLTHVSARETIQLQARPDQGKILAGTQQDVVVKIDLTSLPSPGGKRLPLNLAVALDRSGSMSGAKIEKARQAAMSLVDQLSPGDIFSFVSPKLRILTTAPKIWPAALNWICEDCSRPD